ncbi:hypothetical protein SAMN04487911_10168 [Arenibacter nanhaiticus]|uniref:DUF2064 domain-containing protein n=1 Tax=Arenibacter nanhaiticus TaxID=558155 RepID=A0A1M6A3U7_9FLAO|nr:DUF2064 domain-containing protein [Arenibacter nanhaiticus]SHI31140.1 hypothetical protein SAMN04487911_10168 [Arenibacter nanhaiticus]
MPRTALHRTAILVFAHSSQEEMKHKPLRNGAVIFEALSQHTLKTVKKTNLPYFHFTEKEQQGACFGERFVHAIASVFNMGFTQLITIGNDAPLLRASDIVRAARQVEEGHFVLGPSKDGGFYLMGLQKSCFNAHNFLALPWQTKAVSTQITALIAETKTTVVRLRPLLDVDRWDDLKRLIREAASSGASIVQLLISLLHTSGKAMFHRPQGKDTIFFNRYYNKGSPRQERAFL